MRKIPSASERLGLLPLHVNGTVGPRVPAVPLLMSKRLKGAHGLPDAALAEPCAGSLAGYMVARALGAAPTIADSIIDQLAAPMDRASSADAGPEQVTRQPPCWTGC